MDEAVSSIRFFVNGSEVVEEQPDPEMTLLYYIRNKLHLTGSKLGCGEGGCGACTVMVSSFDKQKEEIRHMSVNACLAPLCSVDGMAVTTVEGIGSVRERLHPCQERIARAHGSQCGFCTPGFVMSMYTLLRNNTQPSEEEVEHAFEGNLCRCTGYRPILEGYKTFCQTSCCGGGGEGGCCRKSTEDKDTIKGPGVLFDASKFIPLDPTQEPIFPPKLKLNDAPKALAIRGPRVQWYRPVTLPQLLELRNRFPHHHDRSKPQYRLVVGNTEVGVEVGLKGAHYPILIAPSLIPELRVIEVTNAGLLVGAAVTLTDLGTKLAELTSTLPEHKTQVFTAILEMLRWFAGPQIRNVSSIAGQIITGSPIADLNPVLMCAQAIVNLASADGSRAVVMDSSFYTEYRQTCLEPNEVLVSVLIPFSKEQQHVAAYKQARRREDDIAIVNGCFSVTVDDSRVVKQCCLVYGGMEKTTIVAHKTQELLVGKVWGEEMLAVACSSLAEEMAIPYGAPGGMPVYRLSLTLSFFYKFYLSVSSRVDPASITDSHQNAFQRFHRQPSRSTQGFQRVPTGQPAMDEVGHPLMHLSALQQATGEAAYIDDLPSLTGELYAGLVISDRAHARFTLDYTALNTMKGVKCVVTAADVPGSNVAGLGDDELVFAEDKVTAIGQLIALVVADSKPLAKQAAKLVKVTYEDLPSVLTIEDAIAANQYFKPVFKLQRGDVQDGFTAAHAVVEGTTRNGGQEHFYLETNIVIAIPKKENGEMELITSSQAVSGSQMFAAKALGVAANRIVARVKRIGGGFGGKETRNFFLSSAVAVAANKARAPVRIMLDRNEDMLTTGHRHPFMGKYKVGCTKEGKITALKLQLYANAGYSLDLSAAVTSRATLHCTNCYDIPNVECVGRICRTNLPSNTAFRGFGGPQGMMAMEQIIDHVASTLDMEPYRVREMNMCPLKCELIYGLELTDCHMKRCWESLLSCSSHSQRCEEVEQFNRTSKWKKRGLAIVPTMYGVAFGQTFLNQGSALVHVYTDGSVLLTHGGMEMGQGLHTKMVQVCARCLSLPVDKIFLCETASDKIANASATAGSFSSDLYGAAVQDACNQLMSRLEPYLQTGRSWEECVKNAYMDRVNLSANGFYATPGLHMDWESGRGQPYSYYAYGASCSEVEVDCLTGDFKVLRSDLLMDVGDSLNPAIDIGQVEGAFTQGLGLFTMEECVFLKDGRLFTTGPGAYKIPSVSDIPIELNVSLMDHTPNPRAIFSSKGVGEPPLFLAASVFFAVKDAIRFFRKEHGNTLTFEFWAPATAEKIRMACLDQFTEMADKKQREKYGDPVPPWNIVP